MVAFGNRPDGPHRRQNKFGKVWEQTKVTLRLVVSYFNWIWVHSRLGTTAAWARRFNGRTLDLARCCCLFHTFLTHNRTDSLYPYSATSRWISDSTLLLSFFVGINSYSGSQISKVH